ncbi:hypothetical protein jhhlp_000723 [Lomentospora prolificans]|uniref:Gelsolin-like domain-containing protein n=1 Tax=Lomentospora prolificans TaxID=41688 RepID=A0A2N3NJ86_9PEZI|nr:hypothetical protein jhhlp_000723 [Lomentospora prolificans]
MAPNKGLVHLKEYDIEDSNVELIGSDVDHQVKYNSAATEPAWNDGKVGLVPGLFIWGIEKFEVVPWPREKYGKFHTGDSYIVLHTVKASEQSDDPEKLFHDIFFWLGSETTQDEAGTAAYKTVELDEFLRGVAVQHREVEAEPSEDFLRLFPRLTILSGGVSTGFRHVEEEEKEDVMTLLRVFKASSGGVSSTVVHDVRPTWQSLDDTDVFILDLGDKIWVWQGRKCSPMEKAKAAQVVHDMTLAKHVPVEVLSQEESRSRRVVSLLGGEDVTETSFSAPRPGFKSTGSGESTSNANRKLFRISDSSGQLTFDLANTGSSISRSDLDSSDVFLLDTGRAIWVWEGSRTSRAEKASWLKLAQGYVRWLNSRGSSVRPIAKVIEGNESPAFLRAIAA